MKSSSGQHWIALDHVRALAAFLVFAWHFIHRENGYPIPFEGVPAFVPFALLDEGHTGVALFMTLSGYLFAKLLDGRSIDYLPFFFNRFLRLMPLLGLVILIDGVLRAATQPEFVPARWLVTILKGAIKPTLPNGGWSITVETHFYLLLPLLLALSRRTRSAPLLLVAVAIAIRTLLFQARGEVQSLSYWTIVGRLDQFVLGIVAFNFRGSMRGRHGLAIVVATIFTLAFWRFDHAGGFYGLDGYPSRSALWIVLPTIEGAAYAVLIAYYDGSYRPSTGGLSGLIGRAGAYSYSIYLLHFFVVFRAADFVNRHVMAIDNIYVASAWALLGYVLMIPVGWASFRFVEQPFLRHRRAYAKARHDEPHVRVDRP